MDERFSIEGDPEDVLKKLLETPANEKEPRPKKQAKPAKQAPKPKK
jgi:hypothetical protein